MTEDRLQKDVATLLGYVLPSSCLWWHTPNGGKRSKATAGRFKAMGVLPGIPDILILHDGLFGIELKLEGSYQSPEQRFVEHMFRENGAKYAVCRSIDDVQETLQQWGVR